MGRNVWRHGRIILDADVTKRVKHDDNVEGRRKNKRNGERDSQRMANSEQQQVARNRSPIGRRSREAMGRGESESVACHKLAQIFTQLA